MSFCLHNSESIIESFSNLIYTILFSSKIFIALSNKLFLNSFISGIISSSDLSSALFGYRDLYILYYKEYFQHNTLLKDILENFYVKSQLNVWFCFFHLV